MIESFDLMISNKKLAILALSMWIEIPYLEKKYINIVAPIKAFPNYKSFLFKS